MSFFPVRFYKLSGAGNTFVLIDARSSSKWIESEAVLKKTRSQLAKIICDKIYGVSADGILFLADGVDGVDYVWDFYNSDGSTAEMCGNAARCAARFCYEILEKKHRSRIVFKTGAGIVSAVILDSGTVRVQMPPVKRINLDLKLKTKTEDVSFVYLNTGVPHLVLKLDSIQQAIDLKSLAKEARSHQQLQPAGANVTFYASEKANLIKAVTFERGVEDYTPACGTGAVAAAQAQALSSGESIIDVQMPGGSLKVLFSKVESEPPYLEGDAVFIGEFNYSTEVFI